MTNFYVRSTDGSDSDTGATWALAKATVTGAIAIPVAAGDTIWVSDAHAESTAGAVTWTIPGTPGTTPVRILGGDDAAAPPTTLTTTGSAACAANAIFTINGVGYVEGLPLVCGPAGAGASAFFALGSGSVQTALTFKNCSFFLDNTSATAVLIGSGAASTNDDSVVIIDSCSLRFGATTQGMTFRWGMHRVTNLSINPAGSTPTTLFFFQAACQANVLVENSDLSGEAFTNLLSWGVAAPSTMTVRNCKLPAAVTMTTGTNPGPGGPKLIVHRCSNGDTQNYFYEADWAGSAEYNSAIYLNAGAIDQDGANFSCKIVATASASLYHPCKSPEFFFPVTSVGSSVTVTVEIVVDGSSVTLQNDDVWLEVYAQTTSGSTMAAVQSSRIATVITAPATLTSSSATWTGLNATNTKCKVSVTFTPAEKGLYGWRVSVGEASRTLYVDPSVTLS